MKTRRIFKADPDGEGMDAPDSPVARCGDGFKGAEADAADGPLALIKTISSDKISLYRTEHQFLHYVDASTVEEMRSAMEWARVRSIPYYCLGNGSNVVFARRKVKSLVIRNRLPPNIKDLGQDRFEVGSGTSISKLLRFCLREERDCCYYLASVPATVGGAVAMNAGRGEVTGISIYEFVEKIYYLEGAELKVSRPEDINYSYRTTPFSGCSGKVITGVVFRFPKRTLDGNPISERVAFAKSSQEHGTPNCGSVFKRSWRPVMKFLKRREVRAFGARWSRKTENWLCNESKSPRGLLVLIRLAQALHLLAGRRAIPEIIIIK